MCPVRRHFPVLYLKLLPSREVNPITFLEFHDLPLVEFSEFTWSEALFCPENPVEIGDIVESAIVANL